MLHTSTKINSVKPTEDERPTALIFLFISSSQAMPPAALCTLSLQSVLLPPQSPLLPPARLSPIQCCLPPLMQRALAKVISPHWCRQLVQQHKLLPAPPRRAATHGRSYSQAGAVIMQCRKTYHVVSRGGEAADCAKEERGSMCTHASPRWAVW